MVSGWCGWLVRVTLCAVVLISSQAAVAQIAATQDTSRVVSVDEARIESLLSKLNLYERVSFLAGNSGFTTAGNAELGIPGLHFADGPNGVRSNDKQPATAFPAGILLAATWNPQLVEQVGTAIGEEARAMGDQVLLGPNLNLIRSPLAGRNFETFGEDPLLTGKLGTGYVRGVQSAGVAATPKHYVGNEQETERSRGSSNIDARALHELYLTPFEMVVRDAKPWALMTSYNRLNGTFMSQNEPLVRELLKQRWGFDGVVMSDWGGTHSTQALTAGLDLEMPGPGAYFGEAMLAAVNYFQVSTADVEDATRRMLRLSARVGALNAPFKAHGVASTAAHLQVARDAATQGITLLKNIDQLLPLDIKRDRKIAVIGPNADVALVGGGGSAYVIPSDIASPLDAIKKLAGDAKLHYERGVDNEPFAPVIDGRDLSTTRDRSKRGLMAHYYPNAKFSGKAKTAIEDDFGSILFADEFNRVNDLKMSVQWRGYFWPRVTGDYIFEYDYIRVLDGTSLTLPGAIATASIKLDGKLLLDTAQAGIYERPVTFFPTEKRRNTVHLIAGHGYPIAIDYASSGYRVPHFRIGVRQPVTGIEAAVKAARDADVALVFVGSGTTTETEGRDRTSLSLHGQQDELVQAIAAANPHTVVIVSSGGPVAMPWADQVSSIIETWLPGQEGSLAIADVLFGKVNPSGKLPVSFPKRIEDSPSYLFFPGFRDANYGESIFMGYRYYDTKRIEPLFAFGHGLSYTQFAYSNLRLPANARVGQATSVSVDIKNTGQRAGAEVAQLYIADQQCREPCPSRELKGFERVELQAGETRTVTIDLEARAFAHYDVHDAAWITVPGKYVVSLGSSSRDLRLSGEVQLVDE